MASENQAGPTMNRRNAILIIVLLLAAAIAAWWVWRPDLGGPSTLRTEKITLATFSKALANAPYHVARRRRMFEQDPRLANVRINYAEFNDRPAIATAFSSGNLDLLFSAEIPAILIRAQGEDVRIVTASTYAFQEIVVPTRSNVRAVNDLRGRRVAVLAGTSSHYGLLRILGAAYLTPQDVNIVFMPAPEGQAAFERGDLDGWAVWAPFVEIQEVAGRGRTLQGSEAVINSVGTMSNQLIRTDPTVAHALVDVVARAKAWIIAHPAEAQQIMAEDLGFDLEVVRRAWPKFHWDATVDERMIADFEAKARFLAEQRLSRDNVVVNIRRDMLALDLIRGQAR